MEVREAVEDPGETEVIMEVATNSSGCIVSTEEKRMTLAYEGLTQLPQNLFTNYGPIIEILDLSHNHVANVEFISNFPNLATLILDHNCITAETGFPSVKSLTTLWLNHNLISSLHPFIPRLSSSFPNLRFLSLMGNEGAPSYLNGGTYYQYLQYRLFVISLLQTLEYLDDRCVTDDQREEAVRLYGRKFYRSFKQALALYQSSPSSMLKRIRNIFHSPSHDQQDRVQVYNNVTFNSRINREYEDDTDEPGSPMISFGEGFRRVEEVGVLNSDSDSSCLSNFADLGCNSDPNPSTNRVNRRKRRGRNLVI